MMDDAGMDLLERKHKEMGLKSGKKSQLVLTDNKRKYSGRVIIVFCIL